MNKRILICLLFFVMSVNILGTACLSTPLKGEVDCSDKRTENYIYDKAKKYVPEHIAKKYVDIIMDECQRQNFPYEIEIANQIETETHFRRLRKSTVNGEYFAYGAMQQSFYWIHLLHWYADDRNDEKLKKNLAWIDKKTDFNLDELRKFLRLKDKIRKMKRKGMEVPEEKIALYQYLNEKRKPYISMTMKQFQNKRYSIAIGVKIMKTLHKKNNGSYERALIEYWAGRNSKEWKYYTSKNREFECDYVKSVLNYDNNFFFHIYENRT